MTGDVAVLLLPGGWWHVRDRWKPAVLPVISRPQWTCLLRSPL